MRSEGELHVQAMRLVCEALEDREENRLEIDWDVINQQLDHMDAILQGITDQRRDDAEEIQTLKKERDAAEAEISKLMKQLSADAVRQELEELRAKNAELLERLAIVENAAAIHFETLRGAMAADDKRLRDAEERVWPDETRGCDAPDAMADEILGLRQQLENANRELSEQAMVSNVEAQQDAAAWQQQVAAAQSEVKYLRDQLSEARSVNVDLQGQLNAARADNVEIRRRLNEETDRHRATNAEKIELFDQKEWANQHAAELVAERDAALAAVDLQRAGIESLNKFVGKVRAHFNPEWSEDDGPDILSAVSVLFEALAELDAETEPAPDANSSATLTGSVVKESLTPAAEDGQ